MLDWNFRFFIILYLYIDVKNITNYCRGWHCKICGRVDALKCVAVCHTISRNTFRIRSVSTDTPSSFYRRVSFQKTVEHTYACRRDTYIFLSVPASPSKKKYENRQWWREMHSTRTHSTRDRYCGCWIFR